MAIALDNTTAKADALGSLTWAHTCTGSNLILFVGVNAWSTDASNCSGVTYNGVAMTLVGSKRQFFGTVQQISLWYIVAPSTGSNNVVATLTGANAVGNGIAISYTGVAQSGQPDAVAGNTGFSANPSVTVATSADNCWVVGLLGDFANPAPALTERWEDLLYASAYGNLQDTNGPKTPAGNKTVNWTAGFQYWGLQAASFAPAVGGAPAKRSYGYMIG